MPLTGPVDGEPAPALFPAPEPAPAATRGGGGRAVRQDLAGSPGDPRRQLALFGAEATDPAVADLAGLLAGPAEVSVMGGTARLAVVVDDAWRVHVLIAELDARGLPASWAAVGDGRHTVRTSYTRVLKPLVAQWLHGPAKHPPPGFHLDGRGLRLWLVAAGAVAESGVLLRLGPAAHRRVSPVGAALAAVGLPAVPEPAPDGPAYRISGRRPLNRFAELVGDPPPTVPPAAWPRRG
ncbi:hypothetical protein [Salinispora arenicola]|uniref:Uncharacterized protein n=1 Tax=Salinispora arenicola TaxID=168697 RepID=A0A542XM43_SALAC|nr:hypothetical protein [Salinispora arenicola]TQL36860.1 hypothetical protein FB564_1993 [Salinispora arenicola]GIM87050.1 hypothetical protein Sar04_37860 [Salinispora arenicola]